MKSVFLFDLDSTLLQMDQNEFLKMYFKLVEKRIAKFKYDPVTFMNVFAKSANSMVKNDGKITNEQLFWNYRKCL